MQVEEFKSPTTCLLLSVGSPARGILFLHKGLYKVTCYLQSSDLILCFCRSWAAESQQKLALMCRVTMPPSQEGKMAADILGFSLRFPESESPSAFWHNLISGRDMQTSDARRWPVGLYNTPPRQGKIPNFDAFDNIFFSVHGKQAQRLDPQARKLLEVCLPLFISAR
jgi:hypothetical protein